MNISKKAEKERTIKRRKAQKAKREKQQASIKEIQKEASSQELASNISA